VPTACEGPASGIVPPAPASPVRHHGDLSVKRLGEFLRLDSATLSPLLKRMEAGGLVRRARGAQDERPVTVLLTAARG
jgi:DNA-binding MarR family transcriptional regulator